MFKGVGLGLRAAWTWNCLFFVGSVAQDSGLVSISPSGFAEPAYPHGAAPSSSALWQNTTLCGLVPCIESGTWGACAFPRASSATGAVLYCIVMYCIL